MHTVAQILRDCARRENVFLASHPTLDLHSLYDTVHILKERVPDFAKTLKARARRRRSPPHAWTVQIEVYGDT